MSIPVCLLHAFLKYVVQVLSGLFDTSPHGAQFLVNAEFPTVSLISVYFFPYL
jgi:hypothetical protein